MAGEAIRFKAGMETADFRSGAQNLQNIAAKASAGITNHFGKIATAVAGIGAAFIGVRAAVQSFNAAIAMGGKLNDLSARTGETAGNLAILQRAFENAGAGADSVGPTINRLQRAIIEAGEGGKEQAEAFAKLGLNLDEIKSKTPTGQLEAVAAALQGVGNDSERGAIAMQLLGRSGGELLPLLRAMGVELDTARGQLGSLPGVMDRTNQALDTIGDNFAAIGQKGTEFMVGLLEKLAPDLADLTDRLANIDAAGFGAKLSEYAEATVAWIAETFKLGEALNNLETAINGITSGNFGEGMALALMTARNVALDAINSIVASAQAAAQSVVEAIKYVFRPGSVGMMLIDQASRWIGATIAANISGQLGGVLEAFGRTLPEMMRPLADSMANSFLPGVRFMGEQLQNIINNIDVSPVSNALNKASEEANAAAEDHATAFRDLLGPVAEEMGEAFARIPKSFEESYKANLENPLIDMKDLTKETAEAAERLAAAIRAANFDAKGYAQSMRDAREKMFMGEGFNPLGGPPESGETGMGVNAAGRKFPWQGVDTSRTIETPKKEKSVKEEKTPTALEALSEAAKTSPAARAALGRIEADQARAGARSANLRGFGGFTSAANAEIRAERRAERSAQRALERMVQEAAKTEKQRAEETKAAQATGASARPSDPMSAMAGDIKEIKDVLTKADGIHDRLPIRVLAA